MWGICKRSMCSVTQSCPTLCDPMDCSPPGSSVHEIFQARILEWVAISSSGGSSRPRDQTHISCISCMGRQILYTVATTWEAIKSILVLKKCRTMFKNKKSFIIPFSPSREIRVVYSLNSLFLD